MVETPSRSAAFSTASLSDSGRRRLIRAESSSPTDAPAGSFVESTAEALSRLPEGSAIAYVTHSIPTTMNATSGPDGNGYVAWHQDVAAEISAELFVSALAGQRNAGRSGRDRKPRQRRCRRKTRNGHGYARGTAGQLSK